MAEKVPAHASDDSDFYRSTAGRIAGSVGLFLGALLVLMFAYVLGLGALNAAGADISGLGIGNLREVDWPSGFAPTVAFGVATLVFAWMALGVLRASGSVLRR